MVTILAGSCTQIELRLLIFLKKGIHTVCMVVVGMGQYTKIHFCQIYAQCLCILHEFIRRTGIQKHHLITVFYVHAKSPLRT